MSAWSYWFFAEWALRLLALALVAGYMATGNAGFAATAALTVVGALDCRINRLQEEVDQLKTVKDSDPA